jgi:hypothetical protein
MTLSLYEEHHSLQFQGFRDQVYHHAILWPLDSFDQHITELMRPALNAGQIQNGFYERWYQELTTRAVYMRMVFDRVLDDVTRNTKHALHHGDDSYVGCYGSPEVDVSTCIKGVPWLWGDGNVLYDHWYTTLLTIAKTQKQEQDTWITMVEEKMVDTLLAGGNVIVDASLQVITFTPGISGIPKYKNVPLPHPLCYVRAKALLASSVLQANIERKNMLVTALPQDVSPGVLPSPFSGQLLPYDSF